MWVWPQVPLEGPPPPTPPRTPPPTPDWAAPSRTPGALQKKAKGVGGRGRERAGREGLWLEGRVLQLQWGLGGDPPSTSWDQTHIWGLPKFPFLKHTPQKRDARLKNEIGVNFGNMNFPWKLKPGFINRVLVAVFFEASKCLSK